MAISPGLSGNVQQTPKVPLASSGWALQHQHGVKNGAVLGEPPESWEPGEPLLGVSCSWAGPGREDRVLQVAT